MSFHIYLVGGAVRDQLLGVKPKDLDFVVLAPSFQEMEAQLIAEGAKIFVSKPEYLTVRCHHPLYGAADFACARKDGTYSDGRHPDSTSITTSLKEDLARRDFTVGAMAQDMKTKEIIDPFGGQEDLKKKYLRFVGNPLDRLTEDKLRAFRALRFMLTKQLALLATEGSAIKSFSAQEFDSVSTERIREELLKMCAVSSKATFQLLYIHFENLGEVVDKRGLWFKPTTEAKN
jgi:tRNA nucleotidyltransferase (CCA-adding enzyme)